jgi:hypothetical protein
MFIDIPKELNDDPWLRVVGFLQQNWAVVVAHEKDFLVVFYNDHLGVFDYISFINRTEAEKALRRNDFFKYSENNARNFVRKAEGEFYEDFYPGGRIYSEGEHWK